MAIGVATYSTVGLAFTQVSPPPTITITAYDSVGAAGGTLTMTNASFTLSGSGDDTFYADH